MNESAAPAILIINERKGVLPFSELCVVVGCVLKPSLLWGRFLLFSARRAARLIAKGHLLLAVGTRSNDAAAFEIFEDRCGAVVANAQTPL